MPRVSERHREYQRQYRKDMKRKVIEAYGSACRCCGETEIVFLCIDHINNDGAKHRRSIGNGGNTYHWLIKNNYPEGFQVLCMNCNWAKHSVKICPHGMVTDKADLCLGA